MTENKETNFEAKHDQQLVEKIEATKYEELLDDAKVATDQEHAMTLLQGIKIYPQAILWSMAVSTGVIMEGFDQVMMNSFWAYPSFQKYYGVETSSGKYEIPAKWQTGISNASSCGQFIGLLITGFCTDRLGYRKTMIAALFFMACFVFIPFFAKTLNVLLAGQFLIGMTWGVFQTITTTYASEVCPVALRGYLTTWVNICWKIGNFLSIGVIRGLLHRTDPWGFRIPFALQWMWPVPISLVLLFAPESPWWLIRKGKDEEALRSLERLSKKGSDSDPRKTAAMIKHAVMLEEEITKGGTYLDCFKGVDLRRTHITCIAYVCQSLCGSQLLGYSTYFLEKGGLDTANAFDFTLGQYSIAIIACLICWFLMQHYGRRTLYMSSFAQMFVILMVIGVLGCVKQTAGIAWATGVILLVLMFTYDIGIGPIVYAIVTEIPSSKLRAKTVALGRATYVCGQIIGNALTPRMLNSLVWNWAQKSGFFWGGATLICLTWIYFFLPETGGLTYAEIDARFANHVPARKFKSTHIDLFGERDHIVPEKIDEEKAQSEVQEEV